MKNFFFAVCGLAIAGGVFWISLSLTEQDSEGPGGYGGHGGGMGGPPRVAITEVIRGSIRETIEYPGTVEANEVVSIVPRVTGIVKAINVDLGDRVRKGDLLVIIDDAEIQQRLKQALANLQLSEAQHKRSLVAHELALREFARAQRLAGQGLGTDQDQDSSEAMRDTTKAEVDLALAEVERMRAARDEAKLGVANTHILSPMNGYVERRELDPGALASPNTPLLNLVNSNPAKIVVHVPESDILIAEVGRLATITVGRGAFTIEGKVERVSPSLDTATRTTVVEITASNDDGKLRPGMSADVTILAREEKNALLIPEEALVLFDDQMSVYTVSNGTAQLVAVTVGVQQEGIAQIVHGLNDGDTVIIKGQFLVEDGREVDYGQLKKGPTDS